MSTISKTTTGFAIAGLFLLSAGAANAVPPADCKTYPEGQTPTLNIGVASNLSGPMTAPNGLVQAFLATAAGSGQVIQVCHDSTGNWVTYLTTGRNPANIGLFLAANTAGPTSVCNFTASTCLPVSSPDLPNNPFSYIQGVPALWSPVQNLIDETTGLLVVDGSGAIAATKVVIADPTLAPYGLAGQQIMQNVTGQWNAVNAQGKLLQPYPTNIDIAYNYIADEDNNAAGYIALSQICVDGIPRDFNYAGYTTGFDPVIQNGAVININPTSNTVAVSFVEFLLDPYDGQSILINDFCYESVP